MKSAAGFFKYTSGPTNHFEMWMWLLLTWSDAIVFADSSSSLNVLFQHPSSWLVMTLKLNHNNHYKHNCYHYYYYIFVVVKTRMPHKKWTFKITVTGLEQPPSMRWTRVKGPPDWSNPPPAFLLAPVHNSICTWHKFLLPKSTHGLTRSAYIFNHLKAALYKEEEEESSQVTFIYKPESKTAPTKSSNFHRTCA